MGQEETVALWVVAGIIVLVVLMIILAIVIWTGALNDYFTEEGDGRNS